MKADRLALCLAVCALAGCGRYEAKLDGAPLKVDGDTIARGAYLAHAADCVACHTVKGGAPYAGGRPFKLPFGTLYAPNITPDRHTGIGAWSDAEFVGAVRHGKRRDGQNLYPAFPYVDYAKMPEEDVLAIKAYLFSLKPVRAERARNTLAFPFNQRWGVGFWNVLFLRDKPFTPDHSQSGEWNRGAYLVEGPGHCGQCHTPRNLAYGLNERRKLAGATIEGWRAYNISGDQRYGVGAWSKTQLIEYLGKGHTEGHGAAGGPMAEVVELSLSHLSQQDLGAIATYLQASRPQKSGVPTAIEDVSRPSRPSAQEARGAVVFAGACAGCHGVGATAAAPGADLYGHRSANDPSGANAMRAVLQGVHVRTGQDEVRMPSFAAKYSDQEIAAATAYLIRRYGGQPPKVKAGDVAKARRE